MADDTAIKASQILLKFVTDKGAKLKYGLMRRAEMFEEIAKGVEPTGYRAEWIREAIRAVMKTLVQKAEEFNTKWPQDCISTKDFLDVLVTATDRIRKQEAK